MPWTTLCEWGDLAEGQGRAVEVDGYRLAVFLHNGRAFVLDDRCPHAGAPMSQGWVEDECAVCPRHAWRFDLADGRLHGGGEGLRVHANRTLERGGRTYLQADLAMP